MTRNIVIYLNHERVNKSRRTSNAVYMETGKMFLKRHC